MTIKAAIIADDFTGALDSSTPFAFAGLSVAAATRPQGLAAALATGAQVVVVNTASRHMPPDAAAAVVTKAAHTFVGTPPLVFKKIDSRLKGNVLAEAEAVRNAFGLVHIVAAPAIPDQGRATINGAVTGRGVTEPLPIAPHVPPRTLIADAQSDADLDRLVAAQDWSQSLALGARGLGSALARRHGAAAMPDFVPHERTLFAIGSQDPITAMQVDRLEGRVVGYEAPAGLFTGQVDKLPALLHSTGNGTAPTDAILLAFAEAVYRAVEALQPHTLVMSGGDTALAILDALGASVVLPRGEAGPGLPWFLIERPNRPSMRCVVKSGGFGSVEALADLIPK